MLGDQAPTGTRAPRDRRAERRETTKAEILDAAWALVREHGLAALSLRDLAARVGMRAPSLYQYFDSKNAIYDAMFEQASRGALGVFEGDDDTTEGDTTGGDMREVLRAGARRIFDFATTDPARAQLLFQRTIPNFEPTPQAYAPSVEMMHRLQARFEEHGITHPDAIDLWTALVSGLISQQIANDPGGNRWARLVDRTVDMFIAEMAPTAAPMKGNE
jgi:AcrR family transcriptional regulator